MLSYVNWCRFVLQRFPLRIQKAISRLVAARYGRWVTGGCWVLLSKMFVVEHCTHFVGYTKMWPIVAWIVRFQTKDERSEWCKGRRDYACSIVLVPQIVGNVFRARTSRKRNENRYVDTKRTCIFCMVELRLMRWVEIYSCCVFSSSNCWILLMRNDLFIRIWPDYS